MHAVRSPSSVSLDDLRVYMVRGLDVSLYTCRSSLFLLSLASPQQDTDLVEYQTSPGVLSSLNSITH